MTELGRDPYGLEHELREAAPQARALFVDELARRVRAQRFRMRPSRARLGLAVGFSALMIAALGVLGAPGLVAHAATAIVHTAAAVTNGGGATSGGTTGGPTSGTDQYAVANGICHRLPSGAWQLIVVDATSLDGHAAHGDIVPAPPWGCPGDEHVSSTKISRTSTAVGGPQTAKIFDSTTFRVHVASADGSNLAGTVSCFDDLHRIVDSAVVDPSTGVATCDVRFTTIGVHPITAVFKTLDVNKWASSAGNFTDVDVLKTGALISVASSRTPAPFGSAVTFTATVGGSAGAAVPTGSVQFFDGTTPLGAPVGVTAAGTAALSTSTLDVGSHTIRAAYGGDGSFDAAAGSVTEEIQAVADRLVVSAPATATAGDSQSMTVTAKDAAGHVAATYRGTVHIASNGRQATLPSDYTFTAADAGAHTFTGVVLRTAGARVLTATDTSVPSLTASATVQVVAAVADRFDVSAPSATTAGVAISASVTAVDRFGNTADGYRGTVRFTSSDSSASLPASYAFTSADGGVHPFGGIVLKTPGTVTLTVTDTAASSVHGDESISVAPALSPPAQALLPQPPAPAPAPQPSATTTAQPSTAGGVTVAPMGAATSAPTTVDWAAATFGSAPVRVSATVAPPVKADGVTFATGSAVIQIDAVTDSGQAITTLNDALDIAIPNAPADVAPMYQRGTAPWVVIPRLGGTTLPAGQPDGWYLDGTTLHILTRHLTKFGLAKALAVKWGTRRRVHLRWAQRIVIYGAPSIDAQATYTLRRGKTVYGRWTRTLPAGKGAPANLWLDGRHVKPGLYRLTIEIKAGPQHWTQVVSIRYL